MTHKLTLDGDSPLSQRAAIAKGRYCHVLYKLLYPSNRVRTAPPVSVGVSVSLSLHILFCMWVGLVGLALYLVN